MWSNASQTAPLKQKQPSKLLPIFLFMIPRESSESSYIKVTKAATEAMISALIKVLLSILLADDRTLMS